MSVPGKILILSVVLSLTAAFAAQPQFTQQQAQRGEQVYTGQAGQCVSCHGKTLQGVSGPALVGPRFQQNWSANTVADLHYIISTAMPLTAPGSLSDEQYLDVVAYILQENGFAPTDTAISASNMKAATLAQAPAQESMHNAVSAPPPPSQEAASTEPTTKSKSARTLNLTGPTQQELDKADQATDSWLMYNKGYMGQRYSTLKQVDTGNVGYLQRQCTYEDPSETGGFQVTPQVYKGVMFITKEYRTVALDAKDCSVIWENEYVTKNPSALSTNRGVALYKGKLFRGTPDAHLLALDANTGKELWRVKLADSSKGYFHSSAPIVYNDLIFMGDAGADWGVKARMHAFNVSDGSTAWSFDVIPTGDEAGAETWEVAESTSTGGGSMWTSYTLDQESDKLYISVGNPAPDFSAEYRPGDNLYTDSVIVLDAKTGKLDHYYQQISNDDKDYDTAAAPVIYRHNGKLMVSVANKAGHLFTYDDAAAEQLYQVPLINTEGQEDPVTVEGVKVCPNWSGGSQWSGPAYLPINKMLVVNSVDWCGIATLGEVRYVKAQLYLAGAMELDPQNQAIGVTSAVDAETGEVLWKNERQGVRVVGGVTTTAGGLVLTGDMLGNFYALDAKDGRLLYMDNIDNAPIGGGISTYQIGGQQYLAVAAGNSSRGATGVNAVKSRIAIYTLPAGE